MIADQKKDIILVIDDESDLREMVQYQFQARGFEVISAANGLEGLDRLKEVTPDLIILDMNMPKMGGLEFYQKICDQNARPKYPVLVLTARANLDQLNLKILAKIGEKEEVAAILGYVQYSELVDAVDSVLQKKK